MISRRDATDRNHGGAEARVLLQRGGSVQQGLDSIRATDRRAEAMSLALRFLSVRKLSGAPSSRRTLSRTSNSPAQGRLCRASLDDLATRKGELGNEQPISTRRTFPTGRPRQPRSIPPLRVLSHTGLPGQRASSAFPLLARSPSGEGAEGVGRFAPHLRQAEALNHPRPAPSIDRRTEKHTGTGCNRCPLMTAIHFNSVAAEREGTSRAECLQARDSPPRAFGSQKEPNDVRT